MKISLLEPLGVDRKVIEAFAQEMKEGGHTFVSYDTKAKDEQELLARSKDQEIIMIANSPYPEAVIRANPQIKLIAVAFTGVDHVALDACKEMGIVVTNCAGYSDIAVAEHAVGLALASLRKICAGDSATRSGKGSVGLMGSEIGSKRVGIIGYGRIGERTARLFSAFGAEVVAYSRTPKEDDEIAFLPLEEVLRTCDIISLHLPSTTQTYHFIDQEKLALLKEGALLINCARGPVVDSEALSTLLEAGKIRAALDVYDSEPPLENGYVLRDAPNTLLTPHVAYLTEEAMDRRAVIEFENVRSFLKGKTINQVNL